jgi:hypothetical protein
MVEEFRKKTGIQISAFIWRPADHGAKRSPIAGIRGSDRVPMPAYMATQGVRREPDALAFWR